MKKVDEADGKANQDKINKNKVIFDYNCGHECRICPFPGAKCVNDSDFANKIR